MSVAWFLLCVVPGFVGLMALLITATVVANGASHMAEEALMLRNLARAGFALLFLATAGGMALLAVTVVESMRS